MRSRCAVQAACDDLVMAFQVAIVGHLGVIVIGGEPMATGPEMRGDHAEHCQEPLGSAGGAEAFHRPFRNQHEPPTAIVATLDIG